MARTEWRRDSAFIANRWRRTDQVVEVENPATGTVIGTAANSSTALVDEAVRAARRAFDDWAALGVRQRAAYLAALHRELQARRELLVQTTVAEVGAPIRVAREAHIDLALTWMAQGELWSARSELGRARELLGQSSTILLLEGCCAVREGRADEAGAAFDDLRQRYDRAAAGADDLAMLAAVLGDWTSARSWLAEACAQRAPFLGYVDVEPAMSALLEDGECRDILRQHGFRAAWPRAAG